MTKVRRRVIHEMTPDRRASLALWILPVLFAGVLFAMRQAGLPFWQHFNLDPDYYYLLNGLRMVEGLAPTDVSHPGTPIQLLIALVMRVLHPLTPASGIVAEVLADPEGMLLAVTATIYPLVAVALWGMGRSIFLATGLLWPALLAQTAPFLSRVIPKFALHPKPEAFMVIGVALLAAVCMAMVRRGRADDRLAALAGVVMAFGIACKIHFAALGVVPLLLMDRRRFAIYAGVTIAAFFVFIAPMLPSWDIWMGWLKRIFLYSGAYGAGEATVIDPARYPRAILKQFGSKLFFTAGFALSLVMLAAYFRLRRRGLLPADPLARLLAGIVVAQGLVVLSVAKQPAAHYMIPALVLTGPQLAILYVMSRRLIPAKAHWRAWATVAAVILVAQTPQMVKQTRELAGWTEISLGFDMTRFDGCAKVFFDAASAKSYAAQRGDMNALGRYSEQLAPLHPADEYTWFTNDHTWWKRGLMQWNQPLTLPEVLARHNGCAVFRGTQHWTLNSELARTNPGFPLDDRCALGEETVFTHGVRCDGSRVPHLQKN